MAATAQLIDFLAAGLATSTGATYSGYKVRTYASDGSTLKAVWSDRAKTAPGVNGESAFTLDATGRVARYADGIYVIKIWTDTADPDQDSPILTVGPVEYSDAGSAVATDVQTVETIAALRALSTTSGRTSAQALGYYAKGDGGGGPVRYLVTGAAAGTYVDNGGSIIVPTGGDGSAAWLFDTENGVNVLWYGAKGDGSASDQTAFANAIASGVKVAVPKPPTNYKLTAMLTLSTAGQQLIGEGLPHIIMATNSTTMIKVTADDVEVAGLFLENTGTGGGAVGANYPDDNGAGIAIVHADRAKVHDNKITKCLLPGGTVTALGGGVYLMGAKDCIVRKNYIYNCYGAITTDDLNAVGTSRNLIEENTIEDVYQGILNDLQGGAYATNVADIIRANKITNPRKYGIYTGSSLHAVVSDNVIVFGADGLISAYGIVAGFARYFTIENNSILNSTGVGINIAGLSNQGCAYGVVENNKILSATLDGILVSGATQTDIDIINNSIVLSGREGINFAADSVARLFNVKDNTIIYSEEYGIILIDVSDFDVSGNTIARNNQAGAGYGGIYVGVSTLPTMKNVNISNNFFHSDLYAGGETQDYAVFSSLNGNYLGMTYTGNYDGEQLVGGLMGEAVSWLKRDNEAWPWGSDSAPSTGTWFLNQKVEDTNAVSGGYGWFYCNNNGTFGTYSEGRTLTGDGTATVTLSGATTVLKPGMFITINGGTHVGYLIRSINGTTMVLSGNVNAGAGQAIAFTTPVFKTMGAIS